MNAQAGLRLGFDLQALVTTSLSDLHLARAPLANVVDDAHDTCKCATQAEYMNDFSAGKFVLQESQ